MGNLENLINFNMGQIVMAKQLAHVGASPKWKVLWVVPSMQWSVSTKSGPSKGQLVNLQKVQGHSRLIKGTQDPIKTLWSDLKNSYFCWKLMAGYDRKVSDNILMGLQSSRQIRVPMLTPVSWSNWRRWPGLMNHIYFNVMWRARPVCIAYLGRRWQKQWSKFWSGLLLANLAKMWLLFQYVPPS